MAEKVITINRYINNVVANICIETDYRPMLGVC